MNRPHDRVPGLPTSRGAPSEDHEWLETDGLGAFASGTSSGIRTRRYHGILSVATAPPGGRCLLVNGVESTLELASGSIALSSQRYRPDVVHPDGASRIERFACEPWPTWTLRLPDGRALVHELFLVHGEPTAVLSWRIEGGAAAAASGARLRVRPLVSGRDIHTLHHENERLRFEAFVEGEQVAWRPYAELPELRLRSNARYAHDPCWYRQFEYREERARGYDSTEDLAAPGVFEFDLERGEALLVLSARADAKPAESDVARFVARARKAESARRGALGSALARAADHYIVARGAGRTIIAGYPWFGDWGRDTFIALRGLCIATGRLGDARDILLGWSELVRDGLLPNRFPDQGTEPEYNSIDAALWYVIAIDAYLKARAKLGSPPATAERARLEAAVGAILDGLSRGTRYGIHVDDDGLLAAGEPGVQLTWMDAKVGDDVITPRCGKPVEVQALWINALCIGAEFDARWRELAERAAASFAPKFWNEERGCLHDVVDVDHVRGRVDATLRPNQILAVAGLPHALLRGRRARAVVDALEKQFWTPLGLRSLAPDDPRYAPIYAGDPSQRDRVYHQGTVWPWLMGPFVEAWLAVRANSAAARDEARARFLAPLHAHLGEAGLGHVSEIADARAPHTPRGCPFQAWSVGELLRLELEVLAAPAATAPARVEHVTGVR